jgi:flagellar hook-length control protein FliK
MAAMEIASVAAGYSATANTASSSPGGATRKTSEPSAGALFAALIGSVTTPDATAAATVPTAPLSEALFDTDSDDSRPVAPAREREDRPRDETNAARDADADADDVEADAPSDRDAREADAAETDRESDQAAADGDETHPTEAQADTAAASGTPTAEATAASDAAAGLVATGEGHQAKASAGAAATATAQAETQAAAAANTARAALKVGEAAQPGANGSSGTGLNGATGQQTGANATAARAATAATAQTGVGGADGTGATAAQTAATNTNTTAAGLDAARAQADALADKVKPDTPMQVKVTVSETARPTGADQTATSTQAATNQANRPSGDLTGAAALRQQVMDGLAKAQGEGFVSNASGKGASTPSIAEQNAAAAEAKAQAAQAHAATQARAAAQGLATGPGQAGADARAGDPAGVVTGGRAADAALKTDIGRASTPGQNQNQGQMNAQSQGSARGSAAPTAATSSGGGDGASGSGSFADQVTRSGQGQAPEQARPDPQARRVVEQLRVNISKAANRGMDRITIKLHPETLGRVEVKLEFGADGRVSAQVTVDKADTLEMLQRDVRGLERALNDAGLKTENGGIQFGLRGDGTAAQGERGRAAPNRPGSHGHGAGGEGTADNLPPDLESIIQAAAKARGGHSVLA